MDLSDRPYGLPPLRSDAQRRLETLDRPPQAPTSKPSRSSRRIVAVQKQKVFRQRPPEVVDAVVLAYLVVGHPPLHRLSVQRYCRSAAGGRGSPQGDRPARPTATAGWAALRTGGPRVQRKPGRTRVRGRGYRTCRIRAG